MPSDLQQNSTRWTLQSRPAKRWDYLPIDSEISRRLETEGGLTPLMARVFAARGFESPGAVEEFLSPSLADTHDPFLLKDIDKALDRIGQAIDRKESIWVYGDYDADGITATAILKSAFDFLSVPVQTYIPHRLNEGYGLSIEALKSIAERGADLIITVDNGSTAVEEIKAAVGLGIDVIVTDHHELGPERPPAHALINPKQPDCEYPFKHLCAAGVAFKLAHALLKKRGGEADGAREFLKSLLDFVAVGTVADIVPLVGENRSFVAHGLRALGRQCRPGLQSLFEIIGIEPAKVGTQAISFKIAPRLNAAGRTDHAEYALELLLTDDPRQARELAGLLDRFNEDRRRIEFDITEEAFSLIDESQDAPVIVIGGEGWHLGVVGIVASRILERYYRPVIVLGIDGEWAKGSARSIGGYDIRAGLEACRDHLEQFGGHTMAAGLRLKSSSVDEFRRSIQDHARSVLNEGDLVPRLTIDASATHEDLTEENASTFERLEPFGLDNRKPMLAIDGLNLIEEPRTLKGKHLKLRLAGPDGRSIWAIGFSLADRVGELQKRHRKLRLAATPFINRWGGRDRLELEFKDFIVED